jgi:Flp pilus assembly protein TadG
MAKYSSFLSRFIRDRRGAVAIITAILMVPVLIFSVGVPIDISRQVQLRSNLQNITDTAALAGSILISQGATPYQACKLSNGYMSQQEADEGISSSSVTNSTSFLPTNASSNCTNPAAAISVATAPYQVIAQATGTIPTTFMAILRPTLTMSTTSAVDGPLDFTLACVSPSTTVSADLDTVYYYLENTDGSLVNADEVTPVTENSSTGINTSQELLNNAGYVNSTTACASGSSQYGIPIKIGIGERVAFEETNQTGGSYPCYYATTWKQSGTLSNGQTYTKGAGYGYGPTTSYCLSSGTTYNGSNALTNFATNAYGSTVGTINYFYSSDYPATLNSTNSPVNLTYYYNTGNGQASGDGSSTVASTNGYSAANQATLMGTRASSTVVVPVGVPNGADIVWFASNLTKPPTVTTSNLVCLVNTPTPGTTGTSYTAPNEASATYNGNSYTNAGSGMPNTVQAQPLVIASTSTTATNALGPGVYQCADTTIGDAYDADPTCSELNGAMLNYDWDDMGGKYNNVIGYTDITYTYSCTNTVSTYKRPALVQ